MDCIYFVKQRNLPILEYAMQRCERASVGVMNGGNVRVGDPFDVANSMIKKGEEARARLGMDPAGAMEGAAATGKSARASATRSLKLDEKVRGRWSAYDRARESLSATTNPWTRETSRTVSTPTRVSSISPTAPWKSCQGARPARDREVVESRAAARAKNRTG